MGFVLCGDPENIPLAKELFEDNGVDPKTRMYALQALASLGGGGSLDFARKYVDAEDSTLKSRAIEAMGFWAIRQQ